MTSSIAFLPSGLAISITTDSAVRGMSLAPPRSGLCAGPEPWVQPTNALSRHGDGPALRGPFDGLHIGARHPARRNALRAVHPQPRQALAHPPGADDVQPD